METITKKRWEWNFGTYIYAFLIFFIITLILVVVKTTSIDHSLVYDDYYDKDIHYQNQYDKLQNYNENVGDNALQIVAGEVSLDFVFTHNTKDIEGKIYFYRASDKNLDFTKKLIFNESQTFSLPKNELSSGKWRAKVEWQSNGVEYYKEFEIFI